MDQLAATFRLATGIDIVWPLGVISVLIVSTTIITQGRLMVLLFKHQQTSANNDVMPMLYGFMRCALIMTGCVAIVSGLFFAATR